MKTAFLILCHKNASQINILISKLLECSCDVYIHLDLKSRNIFSEINKNERVFILPEDKSYSIDWGGVSMIEATLSLINEVRNSNREYDYLCLLSGQDLPLRPMKSFESLLNGNNYIEIIPRKDESYNNYRKRCEIHYPSWINGQSFFVKSIKRLYMLFTGGYSHTFSIFKRRLPFNMDFEFGSQWWCLTYECVMWILDYSNTHPNYLNYMKSTIVPDECFFQSIFMSSPYKETQKNNFTYVNWNRKINRRSPIIFTSKDIDRLKKLSEDYQFARKFDINADKEIIELLLDSM